MHSKSSLVIAFFYHFQIFLIYEHQSKTTDGHQTLNFKQSALDLRTLYLNSVYRSAGYFQCITGIQYKHVNKFVTFIPGLRKSLSSSVIRERQNETYSKPSYLIRVFSISFKIVYSSLKLYKIVPFKLFSSPVRRTKFLCARVVQKLYQVNKPIFVVNMLSEKLTFLLGIDSVKGRYCRV